MSPNLVKLRIAHFKSITTSAIKNDMKNRNMLTTKSFRIFSADAKSKMEENRSYLYQTKSS